MPDPDRAAAPWRMAAGLARSRTEGEAAAWVARAAGHMTGAESVRVWMIDHAQGYRFAGAWPEEGAPPASPPAEVPRAVAFGAAAAGAAEPPFRSRLAVPLLRGPRPLGAVELLEGRRPSGPFAAADAGALGPLLDAVDAALGAVREFAARERRQAETVARLARLFDVGRSFTRSAEMDDLKDVVAGRVQASLDVACAYLWLAEEDGSKLALAAATGPAAGAVQGWELAPGEGLAGRAAAAGEPVRCADAAEVPDLDARPDARSGLTIEAAAAVPIRSEEGALLGVLEVLNPAEGAPFEDDDVAFLQEVASTAAAAIGNARRIDAERRAGDLGALLATAQQLGASLDARKIAVTLVHQAAAVLRYRRAAVGLLRGARLEVTAVTGRSFVDEKSPETAELREILAWAAGLDEGVYVVQEEDGTLDTDRPELREKFRAFFERTGTRSFLAVPLKDDEGRAGAFSIEAPEPYAFSGRDIEAAGLLAALATIALRNAFLFEQIPMVRIFRPFARHRQRWARLTRARRALWTAGAAGAAAALLLVPVPLRVGGDARVLPDLRRPATAEVEGRVAQVLVREGDAVEPGQVLAVLDDADYRAGAEDARARYQVALLERSRFRAEGLPAGAAVEAARLDGLRAEVELWEGRLERTRIRSSVAGLVATPRVEELAGVRLARGDVFCDLVEPGRRRIEVTVPEEDVGLVAEGMPVKVKIAAYPTRSFPAEVERVGVAAAEAGRGRAFLVQARLTGEPRELKPGMTGHAKIRTGPASVARVVLRTPARWIWNLVWAWLP
jgi:GAF domain-containing protein